MLRTSTLQQAAVQVVEVGVEAVLVLVLSAALLPAVGRRIRWCCPTCAAPSAQSLEPRLLAAMSRAGSLLRHVLCTAAAERYPECCSALHAACIFIRGGHMEPWQQGSSAWCGRTLALHAE